MTGRTLILLACAVFWFPVCAFVIAPVLESSHVRLLVKLHWHDDPGRHLTISLTPSP